MKNLISILIVLLNILSVSAQKRTVIEGSIQGAINEKVIINRNSGFPNYELGFVASSKTDSNGNFKISFLYNQTGFVLFYYKGLHHDIFIEPGDSLHLTYHEKQDSFTFSGKGGNDNTFNYAYKKKFGNSIYSMISYRDMVNADPMYVSKLYDSLRYSEVDFYRFNQINDGVSPTYNLSNENQTAYVFNNNSILSSAYNSYIKAEINYNWAYQKLVSAAMYERGKGNSMLDLIPDTSYYSFLKGINIEDSAALLSTAYPAFLYYYSSYLAKIDRSKTGWNDNNLKGIFWQKIYHEAETRFHGIVLEAALAQIMNRCVDQADIDSVKNLLENYLSQCNNKELKDYIQNAYELKKNAKLGNKAYDFTLTDYNGNLVSLHDFKGKVVYIDFSAPWCTYCVQELPYANKLMEELKDKNVEFVFISVYDAKDSAYDSKIAQSSKSFHLMAKKAFKDNAVLGYNVHSLPTFVLVDKNGIVADINAKRPSKGAKEEIEQLLKSAP